MRKILAALLLIAPIASAQSLSIEELKSQIDAAVKETNEYQQILSDPDPARSMAAMSIMMRSGVPELERMAREFGLNSPNPAVRRAALQAWLESGPALEMKFDGSETEGSTFSNRISAWGGSMSPDGSGMVIWQVGPWEEKQQCFLWAPRNNACGVRLSEESVIVGLQNYWATLKLNDSAELEGYATIHAVPVPVPLSIKVTR